MHHMHWTPTVNSRFKLRRRRLDPSLSLFQDRSMGHRRGRAKQRDAAADIDDDPARTFRGLPGLVWLLFESPSGFAIFSYDGSYLGKQNAVEHIWARFIADFMAQHIIWLKQFLEVEDRAAAINRTTGLDKQLKDMLKVWCRPGEKLTVGSHEYKEIIEADKELSVTCLFDDSVMEAMWGVKNLIRILVPQQQKGLTMEERLPMSKGLEMILHHYGFDVKPEMMFSSVELLKIKEDANKYKNRVNSYSISEIYIELVFAYRDKEEKLRYMHSLVKAAHEAAKRLNQTTVGSAMEEV